MSQTPTPTQTFTERFSQYFARPVAGEAARSLSNGAEIEFRIQGPDGKAQETFTFTRIGGKNAVKPGAADRADLSFDLPPQAAEQILSNSSEDVGSIGIAILKLIIADDASKRVTLRVHAGFMTLFTRGYLGVIKTGGSAFASFLASRGLSGMDAIKAVLKKLKG